MIYAPEINATVKEAKRPQQPYVPDTLNSGPESAALKPGFAELLLYSEYLPWKKACT